LTPHNPLIFSQALRMGTRNKPLAMLQTDLVITALKQTHPTLEVTPVGMNTTGDSYLKGRLSDIGGKGLFTKELEEEKAGYLSANNHGRVKDIEHQMDVIKRYLPVMMSEADIRKELAALTDRSLPNVMKHFKTNFSGKVDMGLVSKIVKTL
jgi:hypothetical protein